MYFFCAYGRRYKLAIRAHIYTHRVDCVRCVGCAGVPAPGRLRQSSHISVIALATNLPTPDSITHVSYRTDLSGGHGHGYTSPPAGPASWERCHTALSKGRTIPITTLSYTIHDIISALHYLSHTVISCRYLHTETSPMVYCIMYLSRCVVNVVVRFFYWYYITPFLFCQALFSGSHFQSRQDSHFQSFLAP